MVTEFKLPELGEGVEKATVINVLISEGDKLEEQQGVIEVETDKAAFEVPSSLSGTVSEVKVRQDDEVEVGQVILTVEDPQQSESSAQAPEEETAGAEEQAERERERRTPEDAADESEAEAEAEAEAADEAGEEAAAQDEEAEADEEEEPEGAQPTASGSSVAAAPGVRRLAREIGVDIGEVEGSGPGGRITRDDVKAHARQSGSSRASAGADELPDFSRYGSIRTRHRSNVRRTIGERMSLAWNTVPHVHQFDKADITELEAVRGRINAAIADEGEKITITPILLKLVASTLRRYPDLRCSLDEANNRIIVKEYYHIGMAADTERGLMVPVIRDVDQKPIRTLAAEARSLAGRARDGELVVEDMRGGVFTVSNLGGVGGTFFCPVINYPEVAVLGVPRYQKECVLNDGKPEERLMLQLCLGYDHRVVDGVLGARFLHDLVTALSNPDRLFIDL